MREEMQADIRAVLENPKTTGKQGRYVMTWERWRETWAELKCSKKSLRSTLSKDAVSAKS